MVRELNVKHWLKLHFLNTNEIRYFTSLFPALPLLAIVAIDPPTLVTARLLSDFYMKLLSKRQSKVGRTHFSPKRKCNIHVILGKYFLILTPELL